MSGKDFDVGVPRLEATSLELGRRISVLLRQAETTNTQIDELRTNKQRVDDALEAARAHEVLVGVPAIYVLRVPELTGFQQQINGPALDVSADEWNRMIAGGFGKDRARSERWFLELRIGDHRGERLVGMTAVCVSTTWIAIGAIDIEDHTPVVIVGWSAR